MAAQGRGYRSAGRIDVDQLDLGARQPRRERGDEAADDAGADHRDAVSRTRRCVPNSVDRRFHVGGERRAAVRDSFGDVDDGIPGHDEPVLMGMQTEHPAAEHFLRTVLDNSDRRIAVFDRRRELALLERTAHPLPFALRDLATENEALGAPADRAPACLDQQFTGRR